MSKRNKNSEVSITAFATVLVTDVIDAEEALDVATSEMDFGKFTMDEAKVKCEVKGGAALKESRRHADVELKYYP